ncbi:MAG: SMP-30/gluconolactonase/LRE family protein [Burkholderiaceae bacterium]
MNSGNLLKRMAVALLAMVAMLAFMHSAAAQPGKKLSPPINIANVGFQTPESVLYDARSDVYLVANINGNPVGQDNNGFISRVSPAGQVLQLKWISGGPNGVTLNAPKGMAITHGTLYVADVNYLRKFDANTGLPLGSIFFPEATFLNDVAADRRGTVYVSDTGISFDAAGNVQETGSDAIYKVEQDDSVSVLAEGNALLRHPNGLAVLRHGKVQVVPFDGFGGSKEIYTIDRNGERGDVITLPAGLMDGVIALKKGQLLVSSWETASVYLVKPNGQTRVVASNLPNPADIGWDTRRERLLVPLFVENRVVVVPLDLDADIGDDDED